MNKIGMKTLKSLCVVNLLLLSTTFARTSEKVNTFHNLLKYEGNITTNSVNLKAGDFFKSYISTKSKERERAELYLLGVMDSTEGRMWCDYKTFKTITLRERIFEEFKKIEQHNRFDERASVVIEEILNKRYPCRK